MGGPAQGRSRPLCCKAWARTPGEPAAVAHRSSPSAPGSHWGPGMSP